MHHSVRVPSKFVNKRAAMKLKLGRRYRKGRTYVTRHRDNTLTIVRVGRSLAVDRRNRIGSRRIPRTRTGRLKRGYGHKGDY